MKYIGTSNNKEYYTNNGRILAREGVLAANPQVNFAEYDNDNDGYVDAVYVIFAGYGREAGGPSWAIWSHASSMSSTSVDGVIASRYSCSPELRGNTGQNITNIGVICHEFGHVLGALDYYDTDYETGGEFVGTGQWDMMADGSWNNNGATPAHHNGFTKTVVYNWAPVVILSQPASITMVNAEQNNNSFYRINTTTSGEYFFLENRQKLGFDLYIPGNGLIIYHVHAGVFNVSNSINATHPQRMYPVCAAATSDPTSSPSSYGPINSLGCAWPYGSKTSFTDNTLPSMKSWAGNNTGKPITNLVKNNTEKTVLFDFMGGEGNPTIFEANVTGGNSIKLTWNHTSVNYMLVAYSNTGIFGNPASGTTYSVGQTISGGGTIIYVGTDTVFNHSNLMPSTAHYYKIWARKNLTPQYSSGIATFAYTECQTVNLFPFVENFGSKLCPPCFSVVDNQGNGQVWSFDNPGNRQLSSPTGANGFAILDSRYYGSGNTQNSHLVSGTFDFGEYLNVQVSFAHHYKHTSSEARFSYSIDGGANWVDVATYTADQGTLTAPVTASFDLSSALAGQRNVRFRWSYTGTYGFYWCIDDFTVNATQRAAISISYNGNSYSHSGKIVDYEVVNPGSTKNYQLTINSIGDLPVNLSNVSLNSTKYTITQQPATNIAAGSSTTMTIQYSPTVAGTDTVVLSFNNNTTLYNPYILTIKSNVATQFNATFTINDGIGPVSGATVTLTGYGQQQTNANGQVTFNNVAANSNITFNIVKDGFLPYQGTIFLVDANQNFNVTLTRSNVSITFHLKKPDGTNLTNSSVIVQGYGQQFTVAGQTTFNLPPQTDIQFSCLAPGYVTYNGTMNTGISNQTVEIIMQRVTYSVTVNVKSGALNVPDASVTLGTYGTQLTDQNGVTVFTGVLPSAAIPLTVTANGYSSHSQNVQVTNANVTVNVNLYVGIEDAIIEGLTIYPNPARNFINIHNEGVYTQWQIISLDGKTVKSGDMPTGTSEISISDLTEGVYFIRISNAKKQATVKILKTN
ncbi:MAG TPA: M6 family metalloprotease domain-containing protein [Salinivirgaceae bacterium]|nr:M6 family metalloprotease domain-containing protein [Salinivirgaceae bacterium]